jgi:hypothetical protein
MADEPKVPPPSLEDVRPGADPALNAAGARTFRAAPPRYSKGLQDQICALIRQGQRPEVAAGACGLPRGTFHEWVRRGKLSAEDPRFVPELWEFAKEIDQAKDDAEKGMVEKLLNDGTKEDYRYWLKTQRAQDWSEKVQIEVNNREREMVEKLRKGLDTATFLRVMAVLADEDLPSNAANLPEIVEDVLHNKLSS